MLCLSLNLIDFCCTSTHYFLNCGLFCFACRLITISSFLLDNYEVHSFCTTAFHSYDLLNFFINTLFKIMPRFAPQVVFSKAGFHDQSI